MQLVSKRKQNKKRTSQPQFSQFFTFKFVHYQAKGYLNQLAHMLIRPPRFSYNPALLEPTRKNHTRFTYSIHKIPFQLHLYLQKNTQYVILYLHGNGSSSFQGYLFLSSLPNNVGLACFDFSGCGNRLDSEFITLGQNQSKDVSIAIKYLQSLGHIVVGWGRSMGAVSLLLSMQTNIMICDSAFSNLSQLCKQNSQELVQGTLSYLIKCLYPCLYSCIKSKVQSLAGLNIDNLDICKFLKNKNQQFIDKSILFIHGEQDNLVKHHHSDRLAQSFAGNKKLLKIQGTHNGTRSQKVMQQCFKFIQNLLISKQNNANTHSKVIQNKHISFSKHQNTQSSCISSSCFKVKINQNQNYTKQSDQNIYNCKQQNETQKIQLCSILSDTTALKNEEKQVVIQSSFLKVTQQNQYMPFPSSNIVINSQITKQQYVQRLFNQNK